MRKLANWRGYNFNYGHYDNPPREGTDETDEMKKFFSDFKKFLKKELEPLRLKIYQMKRNYYDVTAVISNDSEDKFLYLSLGDMRNNQNWDNHILIRQMKHSKDWTGGGNHWTNLEELAQDIKWLMR